MARMNQTQRDFFIDDVKKKTQNRISAIRAKNASLIQDMSNEKYNDFLNEMGIKEDLDAIKQAEDLLELADQKLKGVKTALVNAEDSSNGGYDRDYQNNAPNWHRFYDNYFRSYCNVIAEKAFYETEAGEELALIEKTRDNAIRMIMMDGSNTDQLEDKLNEVLNPCGITLLEA